MQFTKIRIAGAAVFAAVLFASPAGAAAKRSKAPAAPAGPAAIELSHALDEDRAERIEPLIDAFNNSQKDAVVKLVRRVEGDAPKALNLVTTQEYQKFLNNKAKFKPLFEVMREGKQSFDAAKLAPELRSSLSDSKGRMFALPLAFSTPVLYINREAFRQAGLNPDAAPHSWQALQDTAGKLSDNGSACPYTTSWPAWVHIDNTSVWNGAEVSDAKGKLNFNGLLQIKHVAMMNTWFKAKYFVYFGRRDEADRRFALGECAMLTSSSALFPALARNKSIDFGVSPLPYHDDVRGAPQNMLADGASLWVANGLKPNETKGAAKFISYVLGPEVQVALTVAGGYLPMTPVARATAESKLLAADLRGLKVAYAELQGKSEAPVVRVAQVESLNNIVDEELETVWANRKPAKEALDDAVARGNAALAAESKGKRGK